jgi:hypothetical protein
MHTESASDINAKRGSVRGRKDRNNQEAVVKLDVIKDRIDELVQRYKAAQDEAEGFNSGIKAAAEASGLLASVVRKFVVARAGEKFADKKNEAMQLSIIFEEVGG